MQRELLGFQLTRGVPFKHDGPPHMSEHRARRLTEQCIRRQVHYVICAIKAGGVGLTLVLAVAFQPSELAALLVAASCFRRSTSARMARTMKLVLV